jgi:hypothetical protein
MITITKRAAEEIALSTQNPDYPHLRRAKPYKHNGF